MRRAVTTLSLCAAFFDGSLFGYHPALMSVAFLLFMAEGVMAGLRFRAVPPGAERVTAIRRHAALQCAALLCAAGGFYAIYRNKACRPPPGRQPRGSPRSAECEVPPRRGRRRGQVRLGKPHFTSYHGRAGVVALTATVASPALGAVAFKSLGLLARLPARWPAPLPAAHRRAGLATWLAAMVAIQLALAHSSVTAWGAVAQGAWRSTVAVAAAVVLVAARGGSGGAMLGVGAAALLPTAAAAVPGGEALHEAKVL